MKGYNIYLEYGFEMATSYTNTLTGDYAIEIRKAITSDHNVIWFNNILDQTVGNQ